ncbi:MAG TPA: hypothetical protein VNJ01_05470 [Bacteriovoracaceae bacterium]|nr:hypothetical protein [Bacteriovoracaceae bacterium]
MSSDQTKKEALFNEVKGSLFEYLVAKQIAIAGNEELLFQSGLDRNYLAVLSQQDRMVRQFYPEMLSFLEKVSRLTAGSIIDYLGEIPASPRLLGKFSHTTARDIYHEADLLFETTTGQLPLSLKLNKKHAFVNTKSGGVKSFFGLYFSLLEARVQKDFNKLVDLEFNRMALELHAQHDLQFPGNFSTWVRKGFSELPGELDPASRSILKAYYARIAAELHRILTLAQGLGPEDFSNSLAPLLGFGSRDILQVICFHDFKAGTDPAVEIHPFEEISQQAPVISPFHGTASVGIDLGDWSLQIRVKPMNKFTTTAIKINCSVKVKRPSDV